MINSKNEIDIRVKTEKKVCSTKKKTSGSGCFNESSGACHLELERLEGFQCRFREAQTTIMLFTNHISMIIIRNALRHYISI